ncbi:trypsin-like peptidase domain-containing protein [Flavivirga aquimarina]|uniref:Trypsin-like peptidase domain-containing protein n=1 Tax=Flavivirga aquimarina TaxID=2027862 RepID=A0ABT8W9Q6_9FLAO|nr:trypsin-like peptidase domain-containing protein [Flavivirga aquimarina]MDO5969873.1 trypsin-like peptidase domain-containing protein [Flavivirga aquimarina]
MKNKTSTLIIVKTSILLIFLFFNQINLNTQEENQSVFTSTSFDDSNSKTFELEKRIQKIYKKVLKSTVTINNNATGVLISKDGYILTAGHVVLIAEKKEISITMSDGSTYSATPLGKDIKGDYALLKIIEKGTWDYLELGSSSNLGNDEACLMFGHSNGYQSDRPALMRIGFYKGTKELGYLKTSCIMMPGDSGGPLVDLNGKVIGLCSHIAPSMEDNFYTPIDPVKENWTKLTNGETFNLKNPQEPQFPENNDVTPPSIIGKPFSLEGGKEYLINNIAKSAKNIHKSVVKIKSTINDKEIKTYGTIINSKGYIVAKASQVNKDKITCELYNGTTTSAKIIGIDKSNDLIVLQIASKKITAINIPKKTDTSVGKLIGAASFKEDIKYSGVISAPVRKISAEAPSHGFLGAALTFSNKVFVIFDGGAAMLGGLKRGDVIIKFDDTKIESSDDRISFLETTRVNQKLKVTVLREGKEEIVHVTLLKEDPKRIRKRHIAYDIDISDRKSDFTQAFTHDMPIEVYESGTPVVDINGNVIGINIAKENRTTSFAIPINIVLETVEKIDSLYLTGK